MLSQALEQLSRIAEGDLQLETKKNTAPFHDPAVSGGFCFCPHCATKLIVKTEEDLPRLACPSCGFIHYSNPIPAAGGIVVKDGRVLFVKRKYEPKVGDWSLPAGFMEHNETPEECALRELKEETGLTGIVKSLVGVYKAGDDPRTQVILIVYHLEVTGGTETPGDDASEIGYFAEGQFPKLAWLSHPRALRDFFARGKGDEK